MAHADATTQQQLGDWISTMNVLSQVGHSRFYCCDSLAVAAVVDGGTAFHPAHATRLIYWLTITEILLCLRSKAALPLRSVRRDLSKAHSFTKAFSVLRD